MNRELTKRFLVAVLLSLCLTGTFYTYTSFRNGTFSLVTLNRAIADTATVLLCLVLLAGPLARNFRRLGFFMMHRKQLGLVVFLYAYIHAIFSLFFLPDVFPISRFTLRNIPFVFGLSGVVILYVLFAYSFQYLIRTIQSKYWSLLQSWGVRTSMLVVPLHFAVMKYADWKSWILANGGEPSRLPVPPTGLVIAAFCLYVVIVRLTERMGKGVAQFFIVTGFNCFIIFVVFAGFWRFLHQ